MNRQAPPAGEAATWKGLVIIGGAVLVGLAVFASFGEPTTGVGSSTPDTEASKGTVASSTTVPLTTTTSAPLRDPKDVKVVVANGTSTSGGSKKIIDALKPACYVVQPAVDAIAKVKAEKRATTTVYSTPGYEREAATITTRLGLQTQAGGDRGGLTLIAGRGVHGGGRPLLGLDLGDGVDRRLHDVAGRLEGVDDLLAAAAGRGAVGHDHLHVLRVTQRCAGGGGEGHGGAGGDGALGRLGVGGRAADPGGRLAEAGEHGQADEYGTADDDQALPGRRFARGRGLAVHRRGSPVWRPSKRTRRRAARSRRTRRTTSGS